MRFALPKAVIPLNLIYCVAFCAVFCARSIATAQTAGPKTEQDSKIELTLAHLFHPKEKQDFDGELPKTHWIGATPPYSSRHQNGSSDHWRGGQELASADSAALNLSDRQSDTLLIERDNVWNQVDLHSGKETPWPVVNRLSKSLQGLEGVSADQALGTARKSVAKMKRADDSVLVKIGSALAILSANKSRWLTRDASTWNDATLDPSARRVGYTSDGDMFVIDIESGLTMRLTNDASETMLDGILDWTYQEEIFGRGKYQGFWFSPDGDTMAMLRIDISSIPSYTLPDASSERGLGIVRRYSKAGDPIPRFELYLWDLRNFAAGKVPPPKLVDRSTLEQERLITGIWFHPYRKSLVYCISDRLQTWRELRSLEGDFFAALPASTGSAASGPASKGSAKSTLLLREESPAWVEPPSNPAWITDGSLVWRSELPSGRARLYRIDRRGETVSPITPEDFEVRKFVMHPSGSFALVTGDPSGTPGLQVYRIDTRRFFAEHDGKEVDRNQAFLPITDRSGFHDVEFSDNGLWMIDRFSTPSEPPTLSVQSTVGKGNRVTTLYESQLRLKKELIPPKLFTIPTEDSVALPALLVRPPSADPANRCPVVIEVYGGPQIPIVSARWSEKKTLYRELLARRGIATLVVDNRSSAGRGIADTWTIRHRMGEVEMKDMQTVVAWLRTQPWVDTQRLAIRGWSFGGFMTLYAMTHSDAFAAGIAGGSVTQWSEYDSIYTERYMGLPKENVDGYASASLLKRAKDLHGNLMLIHGEVDDNVHHSHTLRMAEALQKAGKSFQMMIYPGVAHAVTNPMQSWHLTKMTDDFLIEELLGR